jgi:hypothetical protein
MSEQTHGAKYISVSCPTQGTHHSDTLQPIPWLTCHSTHSPTLQGCTNLCIAHSGLRCIHVQLSDSTHIGQMCAAAQPWLTFIACTAVQGASMASCQHSTPPFRHTATCPRCTCQMHWSYAQFLPLGQHFGPDLWVGHHTSGAQLG